MLVLAFDTSTPAVAVALVDSSREVRADRLVVESNRQGELLAPMIDAALTEAGARPSDLTAIGVGLGPGPFTGLRVGIVTAKAMSDALGVPSYGVCSLDLIGDQHRAEGRFAALSDARRKQVYWAVYDRGGQRLEGPEIGRPDDVADHLRGRVHRVGGAGAQLYQDVFDGFEIAEDGAYPGASNLGWRVIDRVLAGVPGAELTPMYLRRPDAQPLGARKQVTPA